MFKLFLILININVAVAGSKMDRNQVIREIRKAAVDFYKGSKEFISEIECTIGYKHISSDSKTNHLD